MSAQDHLLMEYEQYLGTVKRVAPNTLESYLRDLHAFSTYLDLECPGVTFLTLTADDIAKYLDHLKELGKSGATITRSVASMRNLYQYLMSCGQRDCNPAKEIKAEKQEKKLPQILTNAEIDQLLMSPDISTPKGCRDKAMLELLYATGIRVSELIMLNLEDVNLQLSMLNCHAERGQRFIPIYAEAVNAISDYLYRIRPMIVSEKSNRTLFVNLNGQRLTRQGFWKIIKYYAEKTGIKSDIAPHTLRHSFAAHLFENGAQLRDIKDMLGHADISSTQVYAQLAKNKYKDAYNRFHPRARGT